MGAQRLRRGASLVRRAIAIFIASVIVGPVWTERYEATGWASAFR